MRLQFGTPLFFVLFVAAEAALIADELKPPTSADKITYLDAGSVVDYTPIRRHRGFFENDLRTYCYAGSPKTLRRFFETVELQLDIETDDYTQYEGATPAEVREHHDEQRSLFSFSLFSQKRSRLQLSPFVQQCIGIETMQSYRVRLLLVRVDFWRVIQLVLGVLLFTYAGHLSHNALFYYITGVMLGVCSSFMLLIWLSSKLVPRRTMMYGVLIGGWAMGIYVIQLLWENLQLIVLTYRAYVFWYILITGLISFFFCYRLGPPKNKRSKNIIKWLLQLMSLGMIYFSSRFEEATVAVIIVTIVLQYFPRSILHKLRSFYLQRFPPTRRLLTNEEYYEEGVRETTKALDELRTHARSPDCKQWKVMSKLRDPIRFAAFVEGASHLRDEEILHFDNYKGTDDEDNSEVSLDEDAAFEQENVSYRSRSENSIYLRRTPIVKQEISEDEDDADAVTETIATTGYNLRHTPTPSYNNVRRQPSTPPSSSRTTYRNSPLKPRSSIPRFSTPRSNGSMRYTQASEQRRYVVAHDLDAESDD